MSISSDCTSSEYAIAGLVHLTVNFYRLDDSGCTELLEAIYVHPSLLSRDLKNAGFGGMLSTNERVEEMSFHDDTFNKDDWDTHVAARLECNLYRKWLPLIKKIEDASSTRAAVLARALAKFSSEPHLIWMLLNQNHDIVSSYQDSALDLYSIPS
jgi:hypothetical protein